jgi:hypothetical protein
MQKELTQGDFKRKALRSGVALLPIEAYTPNANLAEHVIRELKRSYKRTMIVTNSPDVLWDKCLQYLSLVRCHTTLSIRSLNGEVPATRLTGDTADIIGWYDWVWYISPEDDQMERKMLGHYVGPSSDIGDALCACILKQKGKFVSRTSVIPLSAEDQRSETVAERKVLCTQSLKKALGKRYVLAKDSLTDNDDDTPEFEKYIPIDDRDPVEVDLLEADDIQHEAFDKYISARMFVPQGDNKAYGTVKRRKRDSDGDLIGHHPEKGQSSSQPHNEVPASYPSQEILQLMRFLSPHMVPP